MSPQGGSGGILEVTVQYQSLQDEQPPLIPADSQQRRTHVTLAVEIRRATGLKDAAILAAQDQPVPLGFAAEVGTNNYAKISFPDFLEVSAWEHSKCICVHVHVYTYRSCVVLCCFLSFSLSECLSNHVHVPEYQDQVCVIFYHQLYVCT